MSDTPLPEPLDDFLRTPPPAEVSAARRQAIYAQTARLVRRRRRVRRLAWGGSLAAAAAGLLLAWTYWPNAPVPVSDPPHELIIVDGNSGSMDVEPEQAPQQPPLPTAVAKEWEAFDAQGPEKAALLFEAGDRYLEDHRDLASALRCYRQAVALADAEALQVRPDDNWLVMALKHDHHKEY